METGQGGRTKLRMPVDGCPRCNPSCNPDVDRCNTNQLQPQPLATPPPAAAPASSLRVAHSRYYSTRIAPNAGVRKNRDGAQSVRKAGTPLGTPRLAYMAARAELRPRSGMPTPLPRWGRRLGSTALCARDVQKHKPRPFVSWPGCGLGTCVCVCAPNWCCAN